MALVVLSVVEQRLDAVRAVLDGADVVEVAALAGVHRATLHRWVARYLTGQLAGLADRSHRPHSCPRQVDDAVEVAVAEMRREHPRWGSRRIRLEMLRKPGPWAGQGLAVPSERTIDRILHRQGLLRARPRKRPRDSYVRFERPGPMQLWQMDIVGGIRLVSPVTGELREAKVVTAVDDHSRYCVIARVVERATGRAVCLALAEALVRFGVPEEINTDNGKQFTDRFGRHGGRNGEVLFDKICRKNGITHRLTAPASPPLTGQCLDRLPVILPHVNREPDRRRAWCRPACRLDRGGSDPATGVPCLMLNRSGCREAGNGGGSRAGGMPRTGGCATTTSPTWPTGGIRRPASGPTRSTCCTSPAGWPGRAPAWMAWTPTRCFAIWPRAGPSAAPASTTT